MTFNSRSKKHDQIAIPHTIEQLKKYGFTNIVTQGHEYDKDDLRNLLAKRRDTISLLKRFKPDVIAIKNDEIMFCEIKSEQNGYNNYAIEFDSFISIKEHSKTGPALYSFVTIDPHEQNVSGSKVCSASNIPYPSRISVPMRFDYELTVAYIKDNWPDTAITYREHQGGSGTAYFLIPKSDKILENWPEFFSIKSIQLSLF